MRTRSSPSPRSKARLTTRSGSIDLLGRAEKRAVDQANHPGVDPNGERERQDRRADRHLEWI